MSAVGTKIKEVIVHPLVLLSVVDHYTRVAKDTQRRVVGILLGEVFKGKVDITNSYAVPFEEDAKSGRVWYLDHDYHENMFEMFKKVNAREKVIGWYSTGPKIKPADIDINELIRRYTPDPVFVIIDVNPTDNLEIPTAAYVSVENAPDDQVVNKRTFAHIPSAIGALEAEEVGVEHLLRDIRDTTTSSLSDQILAKLNATKGLKKRVEQMLAYLDLVEKGKLPPNHQIIYNIQDLFNLLPDLRVKELVKSFSANTNDNMLVIYLSSLIRSVLALHDLINNKLRNKEHEKKEAEVRSAEEKERKEKAEAKEKEKADKAKVAADAAAKEKKDITPP